MVRILQTLGCPRAPCLGMPTQRSSSKGLLRALCSLLSRLPCTQLSAHARRQVPVYAAAVARARLQRLMARLAATLRGGAGAPASAWPPPRALLLRKLWATVFPASDRRHAVLTPAALLLGACLALCPLARAADVARGAPPPVRRS